MNSRHKKYAIIVAGGKGTRMSSSIPKQYLILKNKPILLYSIEAFFIEDNTTEIILVLPEQHIEYWKNLCVQYSITIPHTIIAGGSERFYSVQNGLQHVQESGLIAVHDGVRPLVTAQLIGSGYSHAATYGTAIPVVDSIDSLRKITETSHAIVDRNTIKRVQTPQIFKSEILKTAYKLPFSSHFTDDASVVEHTGHTISLFQGEEHNIKITNPHDLLYAEALLKQASSHTL